MKRKIDLVEEEFQSENEESGRSGGESEDEESRINDVLLPHNDDVIIPRALNTFLERLAKLGVNKRFIKNKKLLS